jgi:molecular chaperone GrpE
VTDVPAGPGGEDREAEEPAGPVLNAIRALQATVEDLSFQVAKEHDRAKAREAVIDRLHEETQQLRAGEARELLRPVLADLRQLRDDLLGQARSLPESISSDKAAAILLESYADSVVTILERYGVTPVRPEPLASFDPRRHRAAGVRETSDPEVAGTIAAVLSDGYATADNGALVAPASVVVYRQAGPPEPDVQGG